MEEMRILIEKGRGNTARSGSPSPFNPSPDALFDHLKSLVGEAERDLKRITGSHQALQTELRLVSAEALDVSCCAYLTGCWRALIICASTEGRRARSNHK